MVLVSSVAAVRFIIVCGAVAIVKELPGVSKSALLQIVGGDKLIIPFC
ncbi:hypothetical protein ABS746_00365 (plasmid) [Escherichia coli]